MQRILCSVHLSIADIIFRSQFTLPPRTELYITDTSDSRPYKALFVTNLYTFYFKRFIVSLKLFSIIILFFSQFNGFFRNISMKIGRDFQSVFTSMFYAFSSCKDVQSAMGQG